MNENPIFGIDDWEPYRRAATASEEITQKPTKQQMPSKYKLLQLLTVSVSDFNKFRKNTNFEPINLSGVDLSETDLSGADLSGTILSETDLSGADLSGTILSGADLSGADLSGADLSEANLQDVKNLPIFVEDAKKRGAINI